MKKFMKNLFLSCFIATLVAGCSGYNKAEPMNPSIYSDDYYVEENLPHEEFEVTFQFTDDREDEIQTHEAPKYSGTPNSKTK